MENEHRGADPNTCRHLNVTGSFSPELIGTGDPQIPVGRFLRLRILCRDCGVPMQFLGLPETKGISTSIPTCDLWGVDARLPFQAAPPGVVAAVARQLRSEEPEIQVEPPEGEVEAAPSRPKGPGPVTH